MVLPYQSPLWTVADHPVRTATTGLVARYIQAIASQGGRPRSRKVPPPLHHARLLFIATLSLVLVGACTTASAGWTYVPAPSMTPIPSTAGSAEPSASGGDNVVQISALGIKYEQSSVTVTADTSFQIAFDNKDAGVPHNVSIHQGDATGAELFKGAIFNGVETRTYTVPPLDAGSYAFVCTVHPTMIGTLTAQ